MNKKRWLVAALVVVLIFIWGNSMLSKEISGAISDTLQINLIRLVGGETDGSVNSTPLRKLGHFTEYTILGAVLAGLIRRRKYGWQLSFAFGALAACIDETIQIFSGRGNSIMDVLLDCCGVLFGIFLV